MKILQKHKSVLYRFRCDRCSSQFEMTEEEREENNWEYGKHKKGGDWSYPHNPLNKFFCPICNKVEYMNNKTIHRYVILEDVDGRTKEYCEY